MLLRTDESHGNWMVTFGCWPDKEFLNSQPSCSTEDSRAIALPFCTTFRDIRIRVGCSCEAGMSNKAGCCIHATPFDRPRPSLCPAPVNGYLLFLCPRVLNNMELGRSRERLLCGTRTRNAGTSRFPIPRYGHSKHPGAAVTKRAAVQGRQE